MTIGVGTNDRQSAMDSLSNMTDMIQPISEGEFRQRLEALQAKIKESGAAAAYLHAGTNLYYFTGLRWSPSERMVAAIVPAEGEICYVAPKFELDTLRDYWQMPAEIHAWEEHESPYEVVSQIMASLGNKLLIDEVTPYFICLLYTSPSPRDRG